ncbi:hypothetical protein E2986_10994 [Frieseomelitta varia]|uniref:Potassium channel domain-containing protein n=1 Tax=Frieseomelitta varia TaxID=561572 RepID=A0A833RQL0_9HYME|nr:hypothetical protein E2986_10994 [Frieseomelitta varia]
MDACNERFDPFENIDSHYRMRYGHISPSTNTGRAITIVYAIFGIPMFLIILADFGKLFTRGIKFLWAFVRRLYYTGSCRKVRRTVPVQILLLEEIWEVFFEKA